MAKARKEIVAKSDGCTLIDNTKMVLNLGMLARDVLFNKSMKEEKEKFLKMLSIACILHDIGKCKKECQKIIINEKKVISQDWQAAYQYFKKSRHSYRFLYSDFVKRTRHEVFRLKSKRSLVTYIEDKIT